MTTPTIELMHRHGSVRNYKPDPIPEAVINQIIAAAQAASTSSNLQAYSVVVTTDFSKKTKNPGNHWQSKTYLPGTGILVMVCGFQPLKTGL